MKAIYRDMTVVQHGQAERDLKNHNAIYTNIEILQAELFFMFFFLIGATREKHILKFAEFIWKHFKFLYMNDPFSIFLWQCAVGIFCKLLKLWSFPHFKNVSAYRQNLPTESSFL